MLDESLLDKNRKYLVGVSGGVDSMALLDMLVKKAYNVIVVHYNLSLIHISKREVINQIIRINQAIDMNLKTKIIKKLEDLFMERLRLKIKSLFLVMNILLVEMKNMNRNMNI